MSKLTVQQKLFANEYVKHGNSARAARCAGYSVRTAKEQGCRLLTNAHVQEAVQAALDARALRTRVCADAVIEKAMSIVCFDIRTLFDEGGRLLPVATMPEEAAQVLAGLDVTVKKSKDGEDEYATTTRVKLPDRNAAIATLLRHLIGMQVQVSGTVNPEAITPLPVEEITRKFKENMEKLAH